MNSQRRPTVLYYFGPFELNVASGQLRKHSHKLRLTGQPIDILVMLLEHAGQVITREEIQKELWSDETFVDFDNSLNKAVNKLRHAISDSPEQPFYIETLPRRGYRFIAPVRRIEPQVTPVAPVIEIPLTTETSRTAIAVSDSVVPRAYISPFLWIRGGIVVALLLLTIAWFFLHNRPLPRVVSAAPLTTTSRSDAYGRIETDGPRIFFLERHGHRWQLSQMPASGGPVQPFPTPFLNTRLFAVSPVTAEMLIAPFESRVESLPLWLMPSVGGPPRRLGEVIAMDATFSPDGRRIAYSTKDGIYEVDRDGLNLRKLIELAGNKRCLSWPPDGKSLRFQLLSADGASGKIWSINADGQGLQEVFAEWNKAGSEWCGRWTRDGRYYVFLANQSNGAPVIWVQSSANQLFGYQEPPIQLNAGPLLPSAVVPSPDNSHFYVVGSNARFEMVRYDEKRHTFASILGEHFRAWPAFSPNGNFAVYRGNSSSLLRSNVDGSEPRELVTKTLSPGISSVSPDGQTVAFSGTAEGSSMQRIYTISANGGKPTELPTEQLSADAPTWSLDGSKILFCGNPEATHSAGLFLFDLKTKKFEKLPGSEGFWKTAWSPDGKYLATVTDDSKSIHIYEWATRKWTPLVTGNVLSPVFWSHDSKFVYYQDVLEEDEPIRRIHVREHQSERLLDCRSLLEGGVQRCGLEAIMPDGSMVFRLTRGDQDVYSLEVDLP